MKKCYIIFFINLLIIISSGDIYPQGLDKKLILNLVGYIKNEESDKLINYFDDTIYFGHIAYQKTFKKSENWEGFSNKKGNLYKLLFDDKYTEKILRGYAKQSYKNVFINSSKIYYCTLNCAEAESKSFYVVTEPNLAYVVSLSCDKKNNCLIERFSIMPLNPFIKDPFIENK